MRAFLLLALSTTAKTADASSMVGLGLNELSGWPGDVLSHIRIWDSGSAWGQIHIAQDAYNWDNLDAEIAQGLAAYGTGVKFTYAVGACPYWLAKYPNSTDANGDPNWAPWLGPGSNSMPTDIGQFNEFISNLATRYPQIDYYEMWNEPQLSQFFYPYNDDELATLATMTELAYGTIKSIRPGAKVLSGSLLPRESSGGMKKAQKYLDAIAANGWNIDAFAAHIYPYNGDGTDVWYTMAKDVIDAVVDMSPPFGTDVWVTETTYNLQGDVISEDQAVTFVNGTYNFAAALGISQIYW
jgi:hypothetical protein